MYGTATSCVTYSYVAQSGSGKWTGASVNNSQSNHTHYYGCRVFGATGQTAQFFLGAASGVKVIDCICEGAAPVNAIHFDAQSWTVVKEFDVHGLHSECSPTNAVIKVAAAGGTITHIENVFTAASSPALVDVTGSGQCTWVISRIPYIAGLTNIIKGHSANGSVYEFDDVGPIVGWGGQRTTRRPANNFFWLGLPTASAVISRVGAYKHRK